METTYVYWVYDETCQNIKNDGYVGVTANVARRFKTHLLKTKNIPSNAKVKIIYEGSREECFEREFELRPTKGIGGNRAVGGSQGWRIGFIHDDDTKQKLRDAWTPERKAEQRQRASIMSKTLIGQKRPAQSKAMAGEKNSMFGRGHTLESRKKMSENRAGKPTWNKGKSAPQQIVECPHCGKSGGKQNMTRYHFDNCRPEKA